MKFELLDESVLPKGFEYPKPILKAISLNLVDFDFWYIMNKEQMMYRYEGMKSRYPNRTLIPFARRDDNDDVACFEMGCGEEVKIIHDFATSGYEQRTIYKTFWDWFKSAIDEMIEYGEYE